ncbi:MAG: hypothetical protein KA319_12720 [Ferruginibacter sp.]|nr:hypothetical protein [Ferruginibacter sp.]
MNRKIYIPLILLFIFILTLFKYKKNSSNDTISLWLVENENKLNAELNGRIMKDFNYNNESKLMIDRTILFTEYDTTIIGNFVRLVKKVNGCFEVTYTYSNDLLHQKKIITITKDTANNCLTLRNEEFLKIDSTVHFKIKIDTVNSL